MQTYIPFSDVAHNKRHTPCVPSNVGNGQSKFGGDPIGRYGDICVREETGSIGRKLRHHWRSPEDDGKASLSTSMDSACASQFGGDQTCPSWRF